MCSRNAGPEAEPQKVHFDGAHFMMNDANDALQGRALAPHTSLIVLASCWRGLVRFRMRLFKTWANRDRRVVEAWKSAAGTTASVSSAQ